MENGTIEEAKQIIRRQATRIDSLNEELTELREHSKTLEVQYQLILREYRTAEILPFK